MTALLNLPATAPAGTGPRRKVWTVTEFHRFGDLGLFEGLRAKLIDGDIIEEGPMNPPHAEAIERLTEAIRTAFGAGWRYRVQTPLVLGQTTDPMPDLYVVAGTVHGLPGVHPTSAALVVEVSDTSLRFDTTDKMSLYAAAGIADYWVLDVVNRWLMVHRDPAPDAAQRFGHGYAAVTTLGPADSVSPLAAAGATVRVADLLP